MVFYINKKELKCKTSPDLCSIIHFFFVMQQENKYQKMQLFFRFTSQRIYTFSEVLYQNWGQKNSGNTWDSFATIVNDF